MIERDELEADELRGNIKSLRREKQFLIYLGIIALAAGGYFWPASVGVEAKYICAAIYFSSFLVVVQIIDLRLDGYQAELRRSLR